MLGVLQPKLWPLNMLKKAVVMIDIRLKTAKQGTAIH